MYKMTRIVTFVVALLAGCSAQQIQNLDTTLNWRESGFNSPEEYSLSKEFPGVDSNVRAGLIASGIANKQQLSQVVLEMAEVNYATSPSYQTVFDYIQDKKEAEQKNTTATLLLNNRTKLISALFNKQWSKTDCKAMGIGFSKDFPMGRAFFINGTPSKMTAPSKHDFSSDGVDTIVLKYTVYPNDFAIKSGIPANTAINEAVLTIKILSPEKINIKEYSRDADRSMLIKGRLVYKILDEESIYSLCE
jgi:hypothetical protein